MEGCRYEMAGASGGENFCLLWGKISFMVWGECSRGGCGECSGREPKGRGGQLTEMILHSPAPYLILCRGGCGECSGRELKDRGGQLTEMIFELPGAKKINMIKFFACL